MLSDVEYPLHIIVRKTMPGMLPRTFNSDGRVGLAAFEDFKQAKSVSDEWESDAEVSALTAEEFQRVVLHFRKEITHVVLNASPGDESSAAWIPTEFCGP